MTNEDDKSGRREPMLTDVNQRKPKGRLGRDVQSKIGQQLRAMYDNVVSEGVPERFDDMLRQLDQSPQTQDGAEKDKGVS